LIADATGFLITSESGVVKFFPEAPWKGFEVVVVESIDDGSKMVGMDVGVEYPQEMIDKVPSVYPDLGILMQKEYGFAEKDPPLYLTHGKIPRATFIENALFKVLAQMDIKA
jgi:non-canonical (house-cleaning) NTP pyrophosphatase